MAFCSAGLILSARLPRWVSGLRRGAWSPMCSLWADEVEELAFSLVMLAVTGSHVRRPDPIWRVFAVLVAVHCGPEGAGGARLPRPEPC